MAGDWIPMRIDLYEDPAVILMAEKLGVREEVVVGYLHRVWSWLSRQCRDGKVTGVSISSLERLLNLPGFVTAMCETWWMEESIDEFGVPVLTIPNWDTWMSQSAKTRIVGTKRQQKRRGQNDTSESVSRSQRDKSVTREEKRREHSEFSSLQSDSQSGKAFEKPPRDGPVGLESVFSELREEDLQDPDALAQWFRWQSRQPGAVFPEASNGEFINVIALARQSLAEGKKSKLGYFKTLVGKKARAKLKYIKEVS